MIKAIIFDFFGVICSDEYWKFIKKDKDMSDEFMPLSEEVNLGKIEWSDFIKQVSERTGKSPEALMRGYASQRLNPTLLGYIGHLHQKYKTAILTNASSDQIHFLARDVPLETLFDELFISSEIGLIKPDSRIYQYALDKLGTHPQETVFIDDVPRLAEGAEKLGINTILYDNFEQMKKQLELILASVSDN